MLRNQSLLGGKLILDFLINHNCLHVYNRVCLFVISLLSAVHEDARVKCYACDDSAFCTARYDMNYGNTKTQTLVSSSKVK